MTKILNCMVLLAFVFLCGCGAGSAGKGDALPTERGELIYESEQSPNEAYVEKEADKVIYDIRVYQNEVGMITVEAASNSAFFEDIQYEITCEDLISDADIDVVWTTLMGSTDPTEEDQLVVADVSLSSDGAVSSERKINFMSRAVELVVDTIND